jgi:hypothetical protein
MSWRQPPATTVAAERALVSSLRSADPTPCDTHSGPNFSEGRYLGAVVGSALRSRRLTTKELGHVIVCGYGVRPERESSTDGGCGTHPHEGSV